jgi:hypothetical protein
MAGRERDIRERPVHAIAEQAAKANELVDEARAAGGGDHPVASTRRCFVSSSSR